ncbi:hypothetical protein F3Y22_tig00110930pilonHSYRG00110 [Hibiscus syriacus]|uniref:Uncharacterized protein n=1 Tax=Hibiscus syriacus TaxID=106335 RepID=A0A6A2ZD97_HIBSY|nr:hypothetical protein F3Y22_tig00110930pilonHSYRG00110 [Hibiscus syriacus]
MAEEDSSRIQKSNGKTEKEEEDDDYMGDLSHFLPPEPSNSAKLSLKKRKKKKTTIIWEICHFLPPEPSNSAKLSLKSKWVTPQAQHLEKNEEALMEEFGSWQKSQWRSRRVVVNYKKAKAALDQLENKEIVVTKKNDEEEGGQDEEEEEEEVTEEHVL